MNLINKHVLMSGADYFSDDFAINPYMDSSVPTYTQRAIKDHQNIQKALEKSGVKVTKVHPPKGCQDGVYTANWGLCKGDKAVLSALPNKRQAEAPYAEQVLKNLGKTIIYPPAGLKFSGQGDNLPCGDYLLAGSGYRSDKEIHDFLAAKLGYEVVTLQTVPLLDEHGKPVINKVTGWADSFFYDVDLAIAVIKEDLIAWCPDAFLPESQKRIKGLPLKKIEVTMKEATEGLALNLVSTGETVVMSENAPLLKAQLEVHGLRTITPEVKELQKGGGFIRCATLTL